MDDQSKRLVFSENDEHDLIGTIHIDNNIFDERQPLHDPPFSLIGSIFSFANKRAIFFAISHYGARKDILFYLLRKVFFINIMHNLWRKFQRS